MNSLYILIPISLIFGASALSLFFWNLRSGQYDDMSGAAERILFDEEDEPTNEPD